MVTMLLYLRRLVPFLCGRHRQLALENLGLRHQVAAYKRTATALRQQLAVYKRTPKRPTQLLTGTGVAAVAASILGIDLSRPLG